MITVVDSHHKVLLAWADYRSKLSEPPRLITLDHHTDTSLPFRRHIKNEFNLKKSEPGFDSIQAKLLKDLNFNDPKTVHEAIEKLNNDEHIIAAIKANIISGAFVLAHNAANTDLEVYEEHKVYCRNISEHDTVLESHVLDEALVSFDDCLKLNAGDSILSSNYILDIDLDYFNTFKSIEPENSETIEKLISGAGIITIATEPDYVESCALDKDLTSEFLLKKFKKRFFPNSLSE